AAEFDAVRMRQNLFGFRRELLSRALIEDAVLRGIRAVRIAIMERDVRVRDRRLIEIFVDTAAAADELGFELDRHTRAVRSIFPLNAVLLAIGFPLFAGRNVFAFALAVEDLGFVAF